MDDGIDCVSLGGGSDAFGSADPLDELAASHPAPVEEGAEAVDETAGEAGGGGDDDDDSVSTSFSASSARSKEKVSIVSLKVVSTLGLRYRIGEGCSKGVTSLDDERR